MAVSNKTFASRWPPNEQPPEAEAAWDAMVLGFYIEKVEARAAGRKPSMSQKEWWSMYGHSRSFYRCQNWKPGSLGRHTY